MKDIVQLIKNHNKHKRIAEEKRDMIFTDGTKDVLKERILEVSQIIVRGRRKPTTCGDEYSIPFGLIEVKEDGANPFGHYYGKHIDWSIEEESIVAEIETIFRGEQDSYYKYTIPVDDNEYKLYLSKLGVEADKRENGQLQKSQLLKQEKEKLERELYIELRQKYDNKENSNA